MELEPQPREHRAHATVGIDGRTMKDELARIGYLGDAPMPLYRPRFSIS